MSGGQSLIENRLFGDGESGKFTTMKSPVVYLQSVQNWPYCKVEIGHTSEQMPNTGERREITSRANAKEAEVIQQSKELIAKTKRSSAIAGTKNLTRRNQEQNDPSRARKSMPWDTARRLCKQDKLATLDDHILAGLEVAGAMGGGSIVPRSAR
jgi:hypothetical protein